MTAVTFVATGDSLITRRLRAVEEAKRQADLTLVSFHSHEMKDGRMSGLYEPTVAIVRPASLG